MKLILVALDGSDRAAAVLAAALDLARRTDARVLLYRAIGVPTDLPRDLLIDTDDRLEDRLQARAHEELRTLAGPPGTDRIDEHIVELAIAWDGIVRTARERAVDLIVIGAHGYGRVDRVLGTTAGKVVNHADRNVLVVRTPL